MSALALLLSSPSQAALVSAAPASLPPATSENASTAFFEGDSESRIGLLCHNDPVNKSDPTGEDTYAIGPYFSVSVGFHFAVSLQISVSTPFRASDFANYRIGIIGSVTPLTSVSTGLSGGVGAAMSHSAANTPSELSGTSGAFGGSGGEVLVGGYDKTNVGSMVGNTPAPTNDTILLGLGFAVSPEIAAAPAEGHAGASTTGAFSISLGEISEQERNAPKEVPHDISY